MVSIVVVNIEPDRHALVHVFKREGLAIVVRICRVRIVQATPFVPKPTLIDADLHGQRDASVQGNRGVPRGFPVVLPIGAESQGLEIPPDGIESQILRQHQGIPGLILHIAVILSGPAQKIIVPDSFGQRDLAVFLRGDGIQIIAAVYRECEGACLPSARAAGNSPASSTRQSSRERVFFQLFFIVGLLVAFVV